MHGGKRAGSGQPKGSEPYITFSISMFPSMRAVIEKAAKREGVTVSRWLTFIARRAVALGWRMPPAER
jgi:hypothetical protein